MIIACPEKTRAIARNAADKWMVSSSCLETDLTFVTTLFNTDHVLAAFVLVAFTESFNKEVFALSPILEFIRKFGGCANSLENGPGLLDYLFKLSYFAYNHEFEKTQVPHRIPTAHYILTE